MLDDEIIPRADAHTAQIPAAKAKVAAGRCDGNCEEHQGQVKLVYIPSWGYFSYCDAAIAEDRDRRGLVVEIVDEVD